MEGTMIASCMTAVIRSQEELMSGSFGADEADLSVCRAQNPNDPTYVFIRQMIEQSSPGAVILPDAIDGVGSSCTVPDTPADYEVLLWEGGAWSGGPAVCGQPVTMTRPVGCTSYSFRLNPDSELGYDLFNPRPVPIERCIRDGTQNDRPTETEEIYSGTYAGCSFTLEPHKDRVMEWVVPEWGAGTPTCSPQAQGSLRMSCVMEGGVEVPLSVCYDKSIPNTVVVTRGSAETRVGNYESCAPEWKKLEDWGPFCEGARKVMAYGHYCRRPIPDGKTMGGYDEELDDSECQGERPPATNEVVGQCFNQFYFWADGTSCSGNKITEWPRPGTLEEGLALCDAAGATCCEERSRYNTDRTNGSSWIAAFSGQPEHVRNYTENGDCSGGTCYIVPSGGHAKSWVTEPQY
ncbi:hypothetical protein [Sphingomonas sp. 3-13AW]|uniref:hypothetical protein n=1 Tax=Sphingomonas sp. 3-13AW TaxID=3050450 RepID=UPI003BB5188E